MIFRNKNIIGEEGVSFYLLKTILARDKLGLKFEYFTLSCYYKV